MPSSNMIAASEPLRTVVSELGERPLSELTPARLQLHWALQPVASIGFTWLAPREDFEHTALQFDGSSGTVRSQPTDRGLIAALGVQDATLQLLNRDGKQLERIEVSGKTLEQLYATLRGWLGAHGHEDRPMVLPKHDMPEHPVGRGETFTPLDAAATREFARWLELGSAVVTAVAQADSRSGRVLVWPHHFDTASLLSLGGERSVGVGVSPGDSAYPEPYVYVTPWPYAESAELPTLLGGGQWHRQGWTGAVLRGSVLLQAEPVQRIDALDAFVRSALSASLEILDDRT